MSVGVVIFWLAAACVIILVAATAPSLRVSPGVVILAAGIPTFALLAAVLFRPTESQLSGLDRDANAFYLTQPTWLALIAFSVIGASILAGGVAVRLALLPLRKQSRRDERLQLELPGAALWVCAIALISQLIGVGPSTVLHADAYLAATGPSVLLRVGNGLLPTAVLIAANVMYGRRNSSGVKVGSAVLLVAIEIYLFGQATRTFSVFFLLVFTGGWLTRRWTMRQCLVRGVIAVALAVASLGIPLTLRGLPEHGLVPAFGYFASDPAAFFSGNSNPFYNALLGVPLSIFVWRQIPPIGSSAIWVSLNPLPGSSSGWNTLAPSLRLNRYEPFSAVGELLNHGWVAVLGCSFALGVLIELLTEVARRTPGRWRFGAEAIIVGISSLVLIRSTQYNLRTSVRLVYYMAFAVFAMSVASRIFRLHGSRSKTIAEGPSEAATWNAQCRERSSSDLLLPRSVFGTTRRHD